MKTLLFSFNVNQIDPTIMQNRLNDASEIQDWLLLTSGLVVMKTSESHDAIAQKIHLTFPGLQFIVSEITPSSCEGWMPRPLWDFLGQSQNLAISA